MDKRPSRSYARTISTSYAGYSESVQGLIMAGDWLKFEANTPEKPEVLAITIELGYEDPDLTVGKLLKVWRWFDQHTVNGNASNVTSSLLDRLIGVTGITKAMANVGWLIINDTGLTLPNFDRHNGKTAKDRALTAKRVASHKASKNGNGASVTSALPREEKRREDNKYIPPICDSLLQDFLKLRKAKRAGDLTETAFKAIEKEATKANITTEQAIEMCCLRGWVGFNSSWVPEANDKQSEERAKIFKDML
jgi:hypothetical protein